MARGGRRGHNQVRLAMGQDWGRFREKCPDLGSTLDGACPPGWPCPAWQQVRHRPACRSVATAARSTPPPLTSPHQIPEISNIWMPHLWVLDVESGRREQHHALEPVRPPQQLAHHGIDDQRPRPQRVPHGPQPVGLRDGQGGAAEVRKGGCWLASARGAGALPRRCRLWRRRWRCKGPRPRGGRRVCRAQRSRPGGMGLGDANDRQHRSSSSS